MFMILNSLRVRSGYLQRKHSFLFAFVAAPTFVRAKPFHLLTQTTRLLKSPTGAFIAVQPQDRSKRLFTIGIICVSGGYGSPGWLRYRNGWACPPQASRPHPRDAPPCRCAPPAQPQFPPRGHGAVFSTASAAATFSDGDKATLHVSFPGAAPRPNSAKNVLR